MIFLTYKVAQNRFETLGEYDQHPKTLSKQFLSNLKLILSHPVPLTVRFNND